jgi:hypothetical protein
MMVVCHGITYSFSLNRLNPPIEMNKLLGSGSYTSIKLIRIENSISSILQN